jgi:DDE superfamily endonuclease
LSLQLAECGLKDRTHEYQEGVIVGQGYSTIVWIPEDQGSWAIPVLHERINSGESPILKAAEQIKQVCEQIANPVIAVLDREYGNATWVLAQAEIKAECLMRVRKNACFWTAPPEYSGRGRPRQHGQKMQLNAPETWMEVTQRWKLTIIHNWGKSEFSNGKTYISIVRLDIWSI